MEALCQLLRDRSWPADCRPGLMVEIGADEGLRAMVRTAETNSSPGHVVAPSIPAGRAHPHYVSATQSDALQPMKILSPAAILPDVEPAGSLIIQSLLPRTDIMHRT
jgi:hypothetical protein